MPAGAESFRRGAADRRRGLPRAEARCCTSAGSRPRSATRAASRPTCRRARRRSRRSSRRPSAPDTASRVAIALDPATTRVLSRRRLPLRGPRARRRRSCRSSRPISRRATRSCRSRTGRRGRLGRLDAAHRASSATGCSSSATTSSSRTRSGCAAASTRASPTRSSIKVNQIGTLTETLEAIRARAERRLHGRRLAPLRRDRGHDDRRPRRGDRTPARSRPAPRRAPTASRSTTSCCGSRRSSAHRGGLPGLGCLPARRNAELPRRCAPCDWEASGFARSGRR